MNNNVICLKWGNKFHSEYVNVLYRKIKQYSPTLTFHCITDNETDIDPNINIIPCYPELETWWNKLYVFSKDFPIKGSLLFLDLDLIITNDITPLFEYEYPRPCIIHDFLKNQIKDWKRFNSSVFRLEHGTLSKVFDTFLENKEKYLKRFRGDQDFIYFMTQLDFDYWPQDWILSYKLDMRKDKFLKTTDYGKDFVVRVDDVYIPKENKIIAFHGWPMLHLCNDKWIKNYWSQ